MFFEVVDTDENDIESIFDIIEAECIRRASEGIGDIHMNHIPELKQIKSKDIKNVIPIAQFFFHKKDMRIRPDEIISWSYQNTQSELGKKLQRLYYIAMHEGTTLKAIQTKLLDLHMKGKQLKLTIVGSKQKSDNHDAELSINDISAFSSINTKDHRQYEEILSGIMRIIEKWKDSQKQEYKERILVDMFLNSSRSAITIEIEKEKN